jgi:uncharacterized SAM-dependent methyltransferase
MHLVSLRPQEVSIPRADLLVSFERGEPIWTESSYKYTAERVHAMGAAAGFRAVEQWTDSSANFALTLFLVEESRKSIVDSR